MTKIESEEINFNEQVTELLKNPAINNKIDAIISLIKDKNLKNIFQVAKPDFESREKLFGVKENAELFAKIAKELIKIKDIDYDKLHLINQYDTICSNFFVYIVLKKYGLIRNCGFLYDSECVKSIICGLYLEHLSFLKVNIEDYKTMEKLIKYGMAIQRYEKEKNKRMLPKE